VVEAIFKGCCALARAGKKMLGRGAPDDRFGADQRYGRHANA